ncbi:radical SAM protein [Tundrisphaera sp. TA3]|uniref:radical SAM protein n=1 Tax=Tundrisphaera sp. TA3 TaxID=3435775 RepID=UPI003EBD3F15
MRILLINPPYQTITSNHGVGHQVPLGLLMVGGPLIDAGHEVRLLDAECRRLGDAAIVAEVRRWGPDAVMTGHAGSTPAHPSCMGMLRAIKRECPGVVTIYGGVYPTYHAAQILADEPAVDLIVRGEGEATALELVRALQDDTPLREVAGLAFQDGEEVVLTPTRPPIADLDAWRTGWELIEDWDAYQCFGLGRAAIVQFSRGCPHRCTYCGQHGFWVKWRHRDPVRLVDEIEWLCRVHGVRFITLADENPTTLPGEWRQFLEELAARQLPVRFFATIRASDIVRDRDILPLYREAGLLYVLMGIESTSEEVLRQVRKGSTTRDDFRACRLLKEHGIFSIIGHIVGLEDETRATFRTALRQLRLYDGDYLNAMYVTPHAWTAFGQESSGRRVVQPDQSKWDYRHQILSQTHLKPWQLFLETKWLELRFHLTPARVWALLWDRDRERRQQRRWVVRHIGRVWLAELLELWPRPGSTPLPSPIPSVPIRAGRSGEAVSAGLGGVP